MYPCVDCQSSHPVLTHEPWMESQRSRVIQSLVSAMCYVKGSELVVLTVELILIHPKWERNICQTHCRSYFIIWINRDWANMSGFVAKIGLQLSYITSASVDRKIIVSILFLSCSDAWALVAWQLIIEHSNSPFRNQRERSGWSHISER